MPHNWRRVTEIDRNFREIIFYHNRNEDGLIKRVEIIGRKTMEYYQGRDDKVVYRSMKFDEKVGEVRKEYVYADNHIG